jgi:hypothetical protein
MDIMPEFRQCGCQMFELARKILVDEQDLHKIKPKTDTEKSPPLPGGSS